MKNYNIKSFLNDAKNNTDSTDPLTQIVILIL